MCPSTSRSGAALRNGRSKVSEALDLIWRRADVHGHVLSHAELAAWPPGERKTIIGLGVIRRTTDATALICEDCGESHPAEIVRDPRRPELPYYLCPRIGRVPVAVEATHRWEVDFDCLAALIRKAIGLGGKAATLVPSRVWLLGRQQQAGGFWELFLARGVCWPDGVASPDQCLACSNRRPQSCWSRGARRRPLPLARGHGPFIPSLKLPTLTVRSCQSTITSCRRPARQHWLARHPCVQPPRGSVFAINWHTGSRERSNRVHGLEGTHRDAVWQSVPEHR